MKLLSSEKTERVKRIWASCRSVPGAWGREPLRLFLAALFLGVILSISLSFSLTFLGSPPIGSAVLIEFEWSRLKRIQQDLAAREQRIDAADSRIHPNPFSAPEE